MEGLLDPHEHRLLGQLLDLGTRPPRQALRHVLGNLGSVSPVHDLDDLHTFRQARQVHQEDGVEPPGPHGLGRQSGHVVGSGHDEHRGAVLLQKRQEVGEHPRRCPGIGLAGAFDPGEGLLQFVQKHHALPKGFDDLGGLSDLFLRLAHQGALQGSDVQPDQGPAQDRRGRLAAQAFARARRPHQEHAPWPWQVLVPRQECLRSGQDVVTQDRKAPHVADAFRLPGLEKPGLADELTFEFGDDA